ncbi:MAG TPA: four helix bundle protein [Candidatus Bathyarchaeia archaeon]|nr:four helix bundle protein [Candidatus Bathyarchaeia archaeon]
MNAEEFKARTKAFALRIVRLVESLPKSPGSDVIGKQLLRSGTSVGANYRAACRARSQADFISKIGIVEEECDESVYWIELLVDSDQIKSALVEDLLREANEILSMIVASRKTALARKSSNRQ